MSFLRRDKLSRNETMPAPPDCTDTNEKRFEFGKNWTRFLEVLDDARIQSSEQSIQTMLEMDRLEGKTFLDVGSGSGLFSLAARNLGARVWSFDYDRDSVACTRELKRRYRTADPDWQISPGSILDDEFLKTLGRFDIVYAWGVLHHTGAMWRAMDNACRLVKPGGILYIMIYVNRGWKTKLWTAVKRTYCSGFFGKSFVLGVFIPYHMFRAFLRDVRTRHNPFDRYRRNYVKKRGMSTWHDWVDWLGGYPYETATRDEIEDFHGQRGFSMLKHQGQEYTLQKDAGYILSDSPRRVNATS